ncbi:unnamed protein product [Nippostrongylus brasiliensis]|uniref:Uncharacterized protein n=1 Tax=Nippostrongylus brasiliensis TaxID=27835 RepID=A0A0N4YLM5_NIPBR|nr:unnamed protein product [Nippostrongylus brasiliensis]
MVHPIQCNVHNSTQSPKNENHFGVYGRVKGLHNRLGRFPSPFRVSRRVCFRLSSVGSERWFNESRISKGRKDTPRDQGPRSTGMFGLIESVKGRTREEEEVHEIERIVGWP